MDFRFRDNYLSYAFFLSSIIRFKYCFFQTQFLVYAHAQIDHLPDRRVWPLLFSCWGAGADAFEERSEEAVETPPTEEWQLDDII